MRTSASIVGCRILVVEDETLIAILIEQALQELGCVIVGPVSKLDVALQLARDETMDAAILDVAIRGGYVYPVADLLLARGIPFVLASGYGDWALPETLREQPRLTKPFTHEDLEKQDGSSVVGTLHRRRYRLSICALASPLMTPGG